MSEALVHNTISITKTINASVEQVFSAWEEPKSRSLWGPPSSDEAIEFLENDFRVGGLDVHRCGQKGDLRFLVETRYYAVDKPHRLLFTERVSTNGDLMSVSLICVVINKNEDLTVLDVTIQIASLIGTGMVEGTRSGWRKAIDQLAFICKSNNLD